MNKISRDSLIADRIKQACIQAAREGFRDASFSGLCSEGAMEAAVSAIQSLDLDKELEKLGDIEAAEPGSDL